MTSGTIIMLYNFTQEILSCDYPSTFSSYSDAKTTIYCFQAMFSLNEAKLEKGTL